LGDSNHATENVNFRKFLCKWPDLEVEIVTSFGDKGNKAYPDIIESISWLANVKYPDVCVTEFSNFIGKQH
jgi:hypothetical protein